MSESEKFSNPYKINYAKNILHKKNQLQSKNPADKEIPSFNFANFYLLIKFQDKAYRDKFLAEMKTHLPDTNVLTAEKPPYDDIVAVKLPSIHKVTYSAVDQDKFKNLINVLNSRFGYDFDKHVKKTALEAYRPIDLTSVALQFASYLIAAAAIIYFSAYTLVGLMLFSLSGLVGMAIGKVREHFKMKANKEYLKKDDKDIEALSPELAHSFNLGMAAAKSYTAQFKSWVQKDALLHPKAFYAGMAAQEISSPLENELINAVNKNTVKAN